MDNHVKIIYIFVFKCSKSDGIKNTLLKDGAFFFKYKKGFYSILKGEVEGIFDANDIFYHEE